MNLASLKLMIYELNNASSFFCFPGNPSLDKSILGLWGVRFIKIDTLAYSQMGLWL